ncbi:spore germination protein GerW family protein [Micromonospora sp. NPDC051296]|uniref:spore germination protein GerW family protein n=1 Tax=Micromonospora sp. NPDC051296 TaxID=3155046 RepID=UPI00342682FB
MPDDDEQSRLLHRLIDHPAPGQVFGEPVTHDGVVVLPVAQVSHGGGGGGGSGPEPAGKAFGMGGGYGATARPVGAFVIARGSARFVPAVDLTRLAVVAACAAVSIAILLRRRRAVG